MIRFRARGKPRARGEPRYNMRVFGEGVARETRAGPAMQEIMNEQKWMMIHLRE